MIVDLILGLVFGVLDLVTGLLPAFTAPFDIEDVADRFGTLGLYMRLADRWIDVQALATVLTFFGVALVAKAIVAGALFVYRLIPGKAS
jgi:hypothetical protein